MKRFHGSENVEPALYLNLRQLSFESMGCAGPLPGTERDEYLRVPPIAMLVVGPLLGLIYVMFLPFIGFALFAWVVGAKLGRFAGTSVVRVLKPAWHPAMAFLSRGKHAERAGEGDEWAEKLEKELDEHADEH